MQIGILDIILKIASVILFISILVSVAFAGTWSDDFSGNVLDQKWKGDRDNFAIENGALHGRNAHPVMLLPLRWVEIGSDWDNYIVQCKINVVTPNLLVCTKGALVLRHSGNEGYVFTLHAATKAVEVFRLSDQEMLLSKDKSLELEKWYSAKAELQGENMSFYLDGELIGKVSDRRSLMGTVGLGVQDALSVLYDDFTITGPKIDDGSSAVKNYGKVLTTWANLKSVTSNQ
jgi:hypothetical protein